MEAYPNPFNPVTRIGYRLPEDSDVKIEIFNLTGSKIHTLFEGEKAAGEHTVYFNAEFLPSGQYFCRFSANRFVVVKKLLLLK
ncbi:MAG TPA: T9SS type A sorting domain-containing protein [bacterium]|nr:T9SS type A sorting domain-containing protein [bacterium]